MLVWVEELVRRLRIDVAGTKLAAGEHVQVLQEGDSLLVSPVQELSTESAVEGGVAPEGTPASDAVDVLGAGRGELFGEAGLALFLSTHLFVWKKQSRRVEDQEQVQEQEYHAL